MNDVAARMIYLRSSAAFKQSFNFLLIAGERMRKPNEDDIAAVHEFSGR